MGENIEFHSHKNTMSVKIENIKKHKKIILLFKNNIKQKLTISIKRLYKGTFWNFP